MRILLRDTGAAKIERRDVAVAGSVNRDGRQPAEVGHVAGPPAAPDRLVGVEEVVRLGVEDAGEVLTLQRAAYVTEAQAHADVNLPALRQSLADVAAELDDRGVLALGARDAKGRLIAAVRARVIGPGGVAAEIGRLAVVPDRQGNGLGTGLLATVEEQLPSSVTELRLFTGEHSAANLRLYARLGYTETTRQPTPAGYSLVHMSKPRRTPS